MIGFCAEPVVGATGGAIPPTPGYFAGVRALCDRYGILFIADEVMCGMGRCGTMYAIEQEGVAPDIITIAKGLGAGYQPIGAVLAQAALVERLRARQRRVPARPYLHRPSGGGGRRAGGAEGDRARRPAGAGAAARRSRCGACCGEAFGSHEHVGDIRGRGLFMALEMVQDRATKQPFEPERKLHAAIKAQAMANGLMVYPMGGTIDGLHGDHILLAPPFIASESGAGARSSRAWPTRSTPRWLSASPGRPARPAAVRRGRRCPGAACRRASGSAAACG